MSSAGQFSLLTVNYYLIVFYTIKPNLLPPRRWETAFGFRDPDAVTYTGLRAHLEPPGSRLGSYAVGAQRPFSLGTPFSAGTWPGGPAVRGAGGPTPEVFTQTQGRWAFLPTLTSLACIAWDVPESWGSLQE